MRQPKLSNSVDVAAGILEKLRPAVADFERTRSKDDLQKCRDLSRQLYGMTNLLQFRLRKKVRARSTPQSQVL